MTILYGIKNCDTVKKAKKWLDENNISYQFHDLRQDGLSETLLSSFVEKSDWLTLVNKRSTTYKNLPDEIKDNLISEVLTTTVLAQPTLLKRPLLSVDSSLYIGFKAQQYQEIFA